MPLSVNDAMRAVSILAEEENLKVTVKQTVRGGMMAGGGAVVGGLVAGPVGMAIGGTIGSVLGAVTAKDFKPLATIIMELPQDRKQQLAECVNKMVSEFQPQDVLTFLALVRGSAGLRMQVLNGIRSYFDETMNMPVHA